MKILKVCKYLLNLKMENEIKLITLGDGGVGKSKLINRIANDIFYEGRNYNSRSSIINKEITVNNSNYSIGLWDTAGEEKFGSISYYFYQNVSFVLLVYDVTNNKSFENLNFWNEELKRYKKVTKKLFVCVVGTKNDLQSKKNVNDIDAIDFSYKYNYLFTVVSSKTGDIFSNFC